MCEHGLVMVASKKISSGDVDEDPGSAFLLAQLGAHAAALFAERIAVLELTPAQSGLLRVIALEPGRSQQAIAAQLGVPPSRLVALIDGLEQRGLARRDRSRTDRRHHAVNLTAEGGAMMRRVSEIARAHEEDLLGQLDNGERAWLHQLLTRLATARGLVSGIHPGYRDLPGATAPRAGGAQRRRRTSRPERAGRPASA
jgi:DNA-binding MarR family transcriptional regulator